MLYTYICVGENMKQLELSAEKAVEREEKLPCYIHIFVAKLNLVEVSMTDLVICICVGENMKQLELSAEKAVEREEKLPCYIHIFV